MSLTHYKFENIEVQGQLKDQAKKKSLSQQLFESRF